MVCAMPSYCPPFAHYELSPFGGGVVFLCCFWANVVVLGSTKGCEGFSNPRFAAILVGSGGLASSDPREFRRQPLRQPAVRPKLEDICANWDNIHQCLTNCRIWISSGRASLLGASREWHSWLRSLYFSKSSTFGFLPISHLLEGLDVMLASLSSLETHIDLLKAE